MVYCELNIISCARLFGLECSEIFKHWLLFCMHLLVQCGLEIRTARNWKEFLLSCIVASQVMHGFCRCQGSQLLAYTTLSNLQGETNSLKYNFVVCKLLPIAVPVPSRGKSCSEWGKQNSYETKQASQALGLVTEWVFKCQAMVSSMLFFLKSCVNSLKMSIGINC